jgi:phosphoribosylformylglycinamidine cyclo-ligase
MGHRMEIYVRPEHAKDIINLASTFNIEAKIVGRCEPSEKACLTIRSGFGEFFY